MVAYSTCFIYYSCLPVILVACSLSLESCLSVYRAVVGACMRVCVCVLLAAIVV